MPLFDPERLGPAPHKHQAYYMQNTISGNSKAYTIKTSNSPQRKASNGCAAAASKPIIQVECQMDVLLRETWEKLVQHTEDKYFRKDNGLVCVDRGDPQQPRLCTYKADEWEYELAHCFDWFKGEKHAHPPYKLARMMLRKTPEHVPEIRTFTAVPVLTEDGLLLQEPGYYPEHGIYYAPASSVGKVVIPKSPKQSAITAARNILLEGLLREFNFESESDIAHTMAVLLTPFVKPMLSRHLMPAVLVRASNPGAGKTTLCNLINIVACGAPCDVMTLGSGEEEMRKRLFSAVRQGQHAMLFDNLPMERVLNSSTLAALLTSEKYADRKLNSSNITTVRNDVLIMLTGNNPQMTPELLRRVIPITLQSPVNWAQRNFEIMDPHQWAVDNRAKLISSLLTLVQAWVVSDMPAFSGKPLPSFGRWCETMGGILENIGIPGFLEGLDTFHEESSVQEREFETLLALWHKKHGQSAVRVTEVHAICMERRLLKLVRGNGTERSQLTKLGQFLKERGGLSCGAWKLCVNPGAPSNSYKVEPLK